MRSSIHNAVFSLGLFFSVVSSLFSYLYAQDSRSIEQGKPIYKNGYIDQPYIVVLNDRRWLCVFTTSGGEEGSLGQHIVVTVSENQGQNWSTPIAIEPNTGPAASWAVPYLTPSGRIYVFYDYNGDNVSVLHGKPIRNDMLGWYCFKYSDDNGKTWSARHRLPVRKTTVDLNNDWKGDVQIMWGICKPIHTSRGMFFSFTKLGKYMLDQGEGWVFFSPNIDTEKEVPKLQWTLLPEGNTGIRNPAFGSVQEEHNIVPLNDGGLFCIYRTTNGFPMQSYSRDGGKTWSLPETAVYEPGGQPIKNPRACPKVFKCQNGNYLLWYHNHSGTGYADRNPAWISGGVEKAGKIYWSQPEILFYSADTSYASGRMSYPDLVEQGGKYWITETQKVSARVHAVDPTLLEGMWNRATALAVVQKGLALSSESPQQAIAMPAMPSLKVGGFSLDVWLTLTDFTPGQIAFDSRNEQGQGVWLTTTEQKTLRLTMSDGVRTDSWDTDMGTIQVGKAHHILFIVDGGPDIITVIIDGKLGDGGSTRQYGWGRFSKELLNINGSQMAKVGTSLHGKVKQIRIYSRYLKTSEAIANYNAEKLKMTTLVETKKLQFKTYPALKLGFTSQNFIECLPVNLETSKALIDYAAAQGYTWMELRDPDAHLTLAECNELSSYAQQMGIEIGYAIQRGLLDADFWTVYERALENAAYFEGPKTIRMLASGKEFDDPAKKGWTETELTRLITNAARAATLAKKKGLQAVLENGMEAFFGQKGQYCGFGDLIKLLNGQIGWQLDTANPFSNCRVHPDPKQVESFVAQQGQTLRYIHLKSAQNGVAMPYLTANPLVFEDVFKLLVTNHVPYVAVELLVNKDLEGVKNNLAKSVAYLREKGYLKEE